jgi:DnaJ like chaperone protein
MVWTGKIVGALFGFMFGGPIGALIGGFIGHLIDSQTVQTPRASSASSQQIQDAFFRATFRVMGHIAKSDGRVSEDEIRAARSIMAELRLGEREVQVAIELFTEGKSRSFALDQHLHEVGQLLAGRPDLCRMFVQIQLQVALWAGSLNPQARAILNRICSVLDVSAYEMVQMEALLRMQHAGRQSQSQSQTYSRPNRLVEAYQVLGVPDSASNAEVTKAYRRLMNQNHPDKLLARGLPESMMKVAEEKTVQIRAAYDAIREARGMK